MSRALRLLVLVGCACAPAASARASVIYDAAADFSASSNPSSVWSYGQSATLTSAFLPFASTLREFSQIESWNAGVGVFQNPSVSRNPAASPVTVGTITFPAGQLAFHPGPGSEYGVIRFVAPVSGERSRLFRNLAPS